MKKKTGTSEISFLLSQGWKNLWKEKIVWLFGAMTLINPVARFFLPRQDGDLLRTSLSFAISAASLCLQFVGQVGVAYVIYCATIGKPTNIPAVFEAIKKYFKRAIALYLVLTLAGLLIFLPLICLAIAFITKRPIQVSDTSHAIFFAGIPLSLLAAMMYFPLVEIFINDSEVYKSIRSAWNAFVDHFGTLAVIGFIFVVVLDISAVVISSVTMLGQNNFDLAALRQLDYLAPGLWFANDNIYHTVHSIMLIAWRIYIPAVFTLAYWQYSGNSIAKRAITR